VIRFDESIHRDLASAADQVARIHRHLTLAIRNVPGFSR